MPRGRLLTKEEARRMAGLRTKFRGGRPRRIDVPRCPCQKHTMTWIGYNGGGSDHLFTCPYYRPRFLPLPTKPSK